MVRSSLRGGMLALAAAAGLLLQIPATQAAVILSKIDAAPAGWEVVSSSSSSSSSSGQADAASSSSSSKRSTGYLGDTHVFTIALARQNVDKLEADLLAVSDPRSARYGEYIDAEAVTARYGPSDAAVDAVGSWLDTHKAAGTVQDWTRRGVYVDVVADVAGANQLFNASYQYYRAPASSSSHATLSSASSAVTKLRTLSYAVPDEVADHVALVDPGNYFGRVRAMAPALTPSLVELEERLAAKRAPAQGPAVARSVSAGSANCSKAITPACLRQMYEVGDYTPDARYGSRVGFASFLGEAASYADLFQFETLYDLAFQNISTLLLDGGSDAQDNTTSIGESNLDAQNIMGLVQPLPVTQWITAGQPPFVPNIDQPTAADNQNEPYVPFFKHLEGQSNADIPQVISVSYGDEEDSVPFNYAVETCNTIGLLGLRGISVLFSSGDNGVGAGCLEPDNKTVEFNAIFPATCPYLTGVGGTVAVAPEAGWAGSQGGFSKYFSRPGYQDNAVGTYLSAHISPSTRGYYSAYTNFAGRGFPDVAAHSASPYYAGVYHGQVKGNGGTSAAAPVTAALVALLNDARFRATPPLPSLGFLNPLLYAFGPQVLTDITTGQSVGCNGQNYQSGSPEPAGSGIVPGAFWNATAGWDPVTGLGTPNFGALKAKVLTL